MQKGKFFREIRKPSQKKKNKKAKKFESSISNSSSSEIEPILSSFHELSNDNEDFCVEFSSVFICLAYNSPKSLKKLLNTFAMLVLSVIISLCFLSNVIFVLGLFFSA